MKKLFDISSEEKQRILEMHETATKKNYLNEQSTKEVVPKLPSNDILTKIGGGFDFKSVLSRWKTQNQGTSGAYYWFSTHDRADKPANSTLSVLMLYTFSPIGSLQAAFTCKWGGANDNRWFLEDWPRSSYPVGWSTSATLKNVLFDTPREQYSVFRNDPAFKLDYNAYSQFVKNYVQIRPNSTIKDAFKKPVNVDLKNEVSQKDVELIKKNPLYLELSQS